MSELKTSAAAKILAHVDGQNCVPDAEAVMETLERRREATKKLETMTKRLSKRMENTTWALVVLTVVVILTGMLVYGKFTASWRKKPRHGGPAVGFRQHKPPGAERFRRRLAKGPR